MIEIKPIASGSSGNCYFVSDGETNILLDCGIPVQKIKEFLWRIGERLHEIDACLVTHSHSDHVKSAQKLADMGIDVYASKGTIEIAVLSGDKIHKITGFTNPDGERFDIKTSMIYALDVVHDAPETLSFIIYFFGKLTGDVSKVCYITDTPYYQYDLSQVNYLMIEANNDSEIISRNAAEGKISPEHLKRVVQNHMSIETCLRTIERMDRSRLKEIWLLHLSNDNAGQDFKRRVQEVAGCEVYIA